jgi:hypothetical protein
MVLFACTKKEEIKLIPIKSGDKWGYIDKTGKLIINPQFEEAHLFREGLALVKSNEEKYGFIGEDGKYLINPIYKGANSFSEGLACVVLENSKPQFIDKEGKIVLTIDADKCGGFSDGMAPIKVKGKWGYIDKTGIVKINPDFDDANKFSEGLAAVSKIDKKTKIKKWGFIDKEGGIKIDFQFLDDTAHLCSPSYFSEGLAFVSNDGKKWGCINKEGKYEINPQFDGAFNMNYEYKQSYEFHNGIAAVKQGENWGFIDKKGKYVINPQFLSVYDFTNAENAAVQSTDKRFGFIDKNGKYFINPQFDDVKLGYNSDFAIVKSSDKYGIIDKKGMYLVNPQFDGVWICSGCWLEIQNSDYLDKEYIVKSFYENSNEEKIRDITTTTTLKDVMEHYPQIKTEDINMYNLSVNKPDLTIGDVLNVVSLEYYFSTSAIKSTPIYKSVQKYSYYYGYYNSKEIDHFDKEINNDAKVSAASYTMLFSIKGIGKSYKIAEALKDYAIKNIKMDFVSIPEIKNSDEKGMLMMKNSNFLIEINYQSLKSEDKKTINPVIYFTIVNKNFEKTFDFLEKTFVQSYLDNEKEKEKKDEKPS